MGAGRLTHALGLLAVVVITGCSLRSGDPVHDRWENRASLSSCGHIVLEQGERVEEAARSELSCLQAALRSGQGAELKLQHPTPEGDPIIRYYRVTPSGTAEVYIDSTKDKFGAQQWEFVECDRPTSALDVNC